MKYILIVVLFNSTLIYSQNKSVKESTNLGELISITSQIMNGLHIDVRKNIARDSALQLIVDTTLPLFRAWFTGINGDVDFKAPLNDLALRFYSNPCIKISKSLDSVLMSKKDTSAKALQKAVSSVIHEITHYLQVTFDTAHYYLPVPYTTANSIKYISQPMEFEAFSVQAYFYLSNFYQKEFIGIMKSSNIIKTKMKLLINAYYKEVYPWHPTPFPKL